MFRLFNKPAGPSAPKTMPMPQPLFDDVVKEIHAQNAHTQLLEQQRETMT